MDQYGTVILSEMDLCSMFMKNPERKINNCYCDSSVIISSELDISNIPNLTVYQPISESIKDWDLKQQQQWKMPQEYHDLDIAKWVLDQCIRDDERQRVGEELLMYLDRNLFPLLQYLKYLVDTMRKHNIVWGVGRGSSVSSYVLFLIGIHKIDSLYYDLDIKEFLR